MMEISNKKLNDTLCRTCLTETKVVSIYHTFCSGIGIVKMLEKCLNHQTNIHDGLPKNMCVACVVSLYQSYTFLTKCNESFDKIYYWRKLSKQLEWSKEEHCYAKKPVSTIGIQTDPEGTQDSQMTLTQRGFEDNPLNFVISHQVERTGTSTYDSQVLVLTDDTPASPASDDEPIDINKRTMICPICDETIRRRSHMTHYKRRHLIWKLVGGGLSCKKCKLTFGSFPEAKAHCQTEQHLHKTCSICKRKCQTIVGYYNHMLRHEQLKLNAPFPKPNRRKICNLCKTKFENFDEIYVHYLSEHAEAKSCILCTRTYTNVRGVQYHILRHSDKKFACYSCKLRFETKDALDKHKLEPQHLNRGKCPYCFKKYKNMKNHVLKHKQERNFVCDECGQMFKFPGSLLRHQMAHAGHMFVCEICGLAFRVNRQLNIHKSKSHGIPFHERSQNPKPVVNKSDIKHVCEICGHISKTNREEILHTAHHEHDHTVMCPYCTNTYPTQEVLDQHVEDDHKLYKCTYCPETFRTVAIQMRHMLMHKWVSIEEVNRNCCRLCRENSNDIAQHVEDFHKIYPCFDCNDVCFLYKAELKEHNKTHLSMYKLSCSMCPKRFKSKMGLKCHEATHTGQFTCRFCKKAFGQATDLKVHERIHTGERPFVCLICDKGFCDVSHLKKHMLTHYNSGQNF